MKKGKRIFILLTIVAIIIILIIFAIYNYKKFENGNNMINKSEEEILEHILNINGYKATLNIDITTNKNNTKYVIEQEFNNNTSMQKVIEPTNIAGVTTYYDGTNLKITNNKINLETIMENYSYVSDNRLWLDSFIYDYKNYSNKKISIENDEAILEVKNEENNKYNIYKKLYIDLNTGKPTKMIVEDINQNILVYILYTKIEIS